MADEKVEEKPQENAADKPAEKGKGRSIIPWIIIAVVVVVAAGAGLGLGRLFAGSSKPETAAPTPPSEQPVAAEQLKPDVPATKPENVWYIDLDPVVANLDEPGATRYVRAALTLEMSGEISAEKGTAFLEQKKPLLKNLLTIYLAGLSIEATRGDKNLKRIQFEICDTFNEKLFPNSKPLIKGILIKEFAVQ
jgi:flagellar basal body-associated protein FliL